MNRRGFIGALLGAAASATFPLRNTLAARLPWPGNRLLTQSEITREMLAILKKHLAFAKMVNRDYENQFAFKGPKIGDTLEVRKPARFSQRAEGTS
jgi:hypothetical protein